MTDVLHIAARSGAPIACDMSTARDTPAERQAEYALLFERALVRRHRGENRVVFSFRADAGIREQVEDLARREAACCPFLAYRVETSGDELIYAISGSISGEDRAGVALVLDAFFALPPVGRTTGRQATWRSPAV